jgi:hypothetical protein
MPARFSRRIFLMRRRYVSGGSVGGALGHLRRNAD